MTRPDASSLALVAAGGVVGATLRHGVALVVAGVGGTLVANVVGSFLLGVVVTRTLHPRVQLFVATGALSSFTTYSTFAVETVTLGTVAGGGYVAVTYALGIAAAFVGFVVGGWSER